MLHLLLPFFPTSVAGLLQHCGERSDLSRIESVPAQSRSCPRPRPRPRPRTRLLPFLGAQIRFSFLIPRLLIRACSFIAALSLLFASKREAETAVGSSYHRASEGKCSRRISPSWRRRLAKGLSDESSFVKLRGERSNLLRAHFSSFFFFLSLVLHQLCVELTVHI